MNPTSIPARAVGIGRCWKSPEEPKMFVRYVIGRTIPSSLKTPIKLVELIEFLFDRLNGISATSGHVSEN